MGNKDCFILKIPTPYADIEVAIKEKDMRAKNDIIEWIHEKFGIPTEDEITHRWEDVFRYITKRSTKIKLPHGTLRILPPHLKGDK